MGGGEATPAMVSFLAGLGGFITSAVATLGYPGLFALMVMEGVITPIPSELVVPFAGYLAALGRFDLVLVVAVATAGATVGSTIAYYVGYYAGRPLLARYGRFIGFREGHLRWTEAWFDKYGDWGNLIGHAIPGVRSFISFPAGIAKMGVKRYVLFTALGSAIWNSVLALAGYFFLERWVVVAESLEGIDVYVLLAALAGLVTYAYWRKRTGRSRKSSAVQGD